MRVAGLTALAPPRPANENAGLWAAWIIGGAAAFAAGSALGRADEPLLLVLLAVLGAPAVAVAIAQPRWFLVVVLFLLPAYIPDALAGSRSAYVLVGVAFAAGVLRWVAGREEFSLPRELLAFVALLFAYGIAAVFAGDRGAAVAETVDLVSFTAVVALLMLLLDSATWLRRAIWAVAGGLGLLAGLAILQQLTGSSESTFAGLAVVLSDGDTLRSAGPLNPNTLGQVLATAAVLAFYLALMHTQRAGAAVGRRDRRPVSARGRLQPFTRGAGRARDRGARDRPAAWGSRTCARRRRVCRGHPRPAFAASRPA